MSRMPWRILAAICALLAMPALAVAAHDLPADSAFTDSALADTAAIVSHETSEADNWFMTSSVIYMLGGHDDGQVLIDPGFGRRLFDIRGAHVSAMMRDVSIGGRDDDSFGITALIVDPILEGKIGVDLILELGAASNLVLRENGKSWGAISSLAFNFHLGSITSIYVGGKLYQDAPGELDAFGLGGGAVLYIDQALGAVLHLVYDEALDKILDFIFAPR